MSDPELSWGGFRYTIVDKGVIDSFNKISIAFKYRKSTIIDCDYCTFAKNLYVFSRITLVFYQDTYALPLDGVDRTDVYPDH